jgi:hypothetical protein
MINLKIATPAEVRREGWKALREKLGPAVALRFMLDYEKGEGDYTELRREIFKGKSVKDIVNDMKKEGYV